MRLADTIYEAPVSPERTTQCLQEATPLNQGRREPRPTHCRGKWGTVLFPRHVAPESLLAEAAALFQLTHRST